MIEATRKEKRLLELAALTARGRVRKDNEDAVLIDGSRITEARVVSRLVSLHDDHLLAVADGMGGHANGEVASRLALELLAAEWSRTRAGLKPLEVMREINRHIHRESQINPEARSMGTTLAGVHIRDSLATWFSVGDSRAYLFRTMKLLQLTIDHVPQGATAANSRKRSHAITQSLGGSYSLTEVWPSIGQIDLRAGDILLVCTDGVSDALVDESLVALLSVGGACADLVRAMSLAIETRGSPDNYSIVLAMLP